MLLNVSRRTIALASRGAAGWPNDDVSVSVFTPLRRDRGRVAVCLPVVVFAVVWSIRL